MYFREQGREAIDFIQSTPHCSGDAEGEDERNKCCDWTATKGSVRHTFPPTKPKALRTSGRMQSKVFKLLGP